MLDGEQTSASGGRHIHFDNGCFQTENQWILTMGLTEVKVLTFSMQVYEISTEGVPTFLVFLFSGNKWKKCPIIAELL